jgi:ATP-binding protein involved in chromosome partitioning
LHVGANGVEPALTADGIRVMSTDLLLAEGAPFRLRVDGGERFTRRALVEAGVLREFLSDVDWGTLDVLLADLAPGAHALEDLAELVPGLTGVLVVTIPSDESRRAVQRNVRRAGQVGLRVLGVVENMSGYACGCCGETGPLFNGTAGADLAAEFGVPLLARLPFVGSSARHDESHHAGRLTALADALLEVTS